MNHPPYCSKLLLILYFLVFQVEVLSESVKGSPAEKAKTIFLSMNDAVDLNAFYALTPGEAGKELRTAQAEKNPLEQARLKRAFVNQNPTNPLSARVALELADTAYKQGLFSEALSAYETSWSLSKFQRTVDGTQLANRALAGYAGLLARVGRKDELEALLKSIGDRQLTGRAGQELINAREGLHLMRFRPDIAYLCGPTALQTIHQQMNGRPHIMIRNEASTAQGVSLARLEALATEAGMKFQAAKREKGAEVIVPSVVHWNLNHYAAITENRGDYYHVVDPTFAEDFWVTKEALETETSGYFLVADGPLPQGWLAVSKEDASMVWGKGAVQAHDPASTRASDLQTPKNNSCGVGMAVYSAHLHMVSLKITDIPVAYTPSYGLELNFQLDYIERDISQPSVPTHSYLGPQWLHRFHSFLELSFIPGIDLHEAEITLPGGGFEIYTFDTAYPTRIPGPFIDAEALYTDISPETGTQLKANYLSFSGDAWFMVGYELFYPDGTSYVYNSTEVDQSRTYLQRIRGKELGKAPLNLVYENIVASSSVPLGAVRLNSITDATGSVAEILYTDRLANFPSVTITPTTTEPLRIIGFLDPAGRLAEIRDDTEGRLEKIIDAEGLVSEFTYEGLGDQIDSLTTPYGTSTFRRGGAEPEEPNVLGWLEMEDALGRVERVEYTQNAPGISSVDLESRVYYNYPGMLIPEDATAAEAATLLFPSKIARLDDEGDTWLETTEYNSAGNISRFVDADDREISTTYDYNFLSLPPGTRPLSLKLNAKELVLYTYGDSDFPLLPTQIHRAGEVPTTFTYNSVGQVLTSSQAGNTTTYVYDQADGSATKGNLLQVQAPGSLGLLASYTYDAVNRVQTATDSLGRTTAFTYDHLDRILTVTYPDGSSETTDYGGRLFPESLVDRLGRLTTWDYNDAGQVMSETSWGIPTEAAMQGVGALTTHYQWCNCGGLSALIDPAGNATHWEHDVLGRVTRKTDAQGRSTHFAFSARLGRTQQVTRPDEVMTEYAYSPGGDVLGVDFSDGITPGLRYIYDEDLGWLDAVSQVQPGTETVLDTVSYTYRPYTTDVTTALTGAGLLHTETGVQNHSLVEVGYDSRGNPTTQTLFNDVGAALHIVNWQWDALNRMSVENDVITYQTFTYEGASNRVNSRNMIHNATGPLDFLESYGYELPAVGGRLTSLNRRIGTAAPFTSYTYAHLDNDQLESIQEDRAGEAARVQEFVYDSQNRLQDVTKTFDGNPSGHFEYVFDAAGNRVTALSPNRTAHWQVDVTNQLQAQTALGHRRVVGTVNEPSHVQINGTFVPVDENLRFEGIIDSRETRNVTIEATDAESNVTTTEYRFAEPENTAGAVLRHDANGRLAEVERPEKTVSYTWDARDQLIHSEVMARDGSNGKRKTYGYDPLGRLIRTDLETWDGSAWNVSGTDEQYIYAGLEKLQKRITENTLIARSYYADGFINGSDPYFYGRDHLGSIVEVIQVPSGNVVSRREYSPYGEILSETGTIFADFGFTGHFYDEDFGLHHAPARVYDAALGRWLTPDPLQDAELLPEGSNLYTYVGNDPINFVDPYGFCRQSGNNGKNQRKGSPPRQNGGSGSGGGGPPRKVASSATPEDSGGGEFSSPTPILLGRFMETRVKPAARALGFDWYKAKPRGVSKTDFDKWEINNVRWLREQVRSGRAIFDIGVPKGVSPGRFVTAERNALREMGYSMQRRGRIKVGSEYFQIFEWVK